jgi:phage terminase large subunit GpA-like protein
MTSAKKMRPPTIAELVGRAQFQTLEELAAHAFSGMVPTENLSVTEAAQRYTRVPAGGNHGQPWSLDRTPYLQEPQDVLTSMDYQGMVFVGPARTGKSVMLQNWISHTVKHDPSDMMFVHNTMAIARRWSKGALDRYLRLSKEIRKEQLTSKKDDNTFDKTFKSGMMLLLAYPTVENLSDITLKNVAFLDYDRNEDDVDGEGPPYDLGKKRTTTFGRLAMAAAESSPNPDKEILDPKWIADPRFPHQAPPIRGIFELYNRGDRRRWNWTCPSCDEGFEPDFSLLRWPDSEDLMESAEQVEMVCPCCGFPMAPSMKQELNSAGRWIKEGQRILDGQIVERNGVKLARSDIASFWMKGPAAGYQKWQSLVLEYLRAERTYAETGDEAPLRKTVTADQGSYYISKARLSERVPEDLMNRAEDWGSTEEEPTVPEGVRFLIATVDVQARSFVAQVHGFMPNGDMVVIDSFKLRLSNRLNRNGERLPMEPPAYLEDWMVLVDEVMLKSYALADGSGRRMNIRATGCDSGGREGTTAQAYDFWRRLKEDPRRLHRRFILLKGEPSKTRPRVMTNWPDSHKKDKYAVARGDVPVVFLNSNPLKDIVAGMLARRIGEDRDESLGESGMVRYANWMPDWFYKQMTNEIRTEKGWENPASRRNEVWDLCYYAQGVALRPMERGTPHVHFGIDRMDWDNPPDWASDWDVNPLVFGGEQPAIEEVGSKRKRNLADIGKNLL